MQVRVYATLRPIVGGSKVDLATDVGDTFRQMLDELLVRWPGLSRELAPNNNATAMITLKCDLRVSDI